MWAMPHAEGKTPIIITKPEDINKKTGEGSVVFSPFLILTQ
jgi:hypothetical protein